MVRLVLCALALFVAGGLTETVPKNLPQKTVDNVFIKKQLELMTLFYHTHEPNHMPEQHKISTTWSIEKNLDHYTNVNAVKSFTELWEYGLYPRGLPFTVTESTHKYELQILFNVLYSAKDYETFYKTAVWARDHVNEGLFVYAFSAAIVHRHDTQGIVIPPIYEVFPSYFHNGEIMTTAQRINTHGTKWVDDFITTFLWNNDVVIRSNMTTWAYDINEETRMSYFTHDFSLLTYYYNLNLVYPSWLSSEVVPLVKDRRGEFFWFYHKQLISRYYLERLSNGLGEISELTWDHPVESGYQSGLLYHNGIPFPSRPNHFVFDESRRTREIEQLLAFERRVRDAIDLGYVVNTVGEHINIRTPEAIDILGRVVEAGVDSPNVKYYGDFITIWKQLLGNSHLSHFKHLSGAFSRDFPNLPLVNPSVLEHYQTALRDPAFYMIWKRVLNLFVEWQWQLPKYKPEELAEPTIAIKDVEVDKLVTYFENTYVNVTNHLHMDQWEAEKVEDSVSVLVQRPRLQHKNFQVRVKVNSETAKTVVVRFFLGPKYDSEGHEIPLHRNYMNFFQLDQFTYDLVAGETVIKRDSTQNLFHVNSWESGHDLYVKYENALHGKGHVTVDLSERIDGFPYGLMLPKGRVGGMPFVFFVHISEFHAPKVPTGTGYDSTISLGVGSGARFMVDQPLNYPLNKPIIPYMIQHATNFWFEDVMIYHKPTPDVVFFHTEY